MPTQTAGGILPHPRGRGMSKAKTGESEELRTKKRDLESERFHSKRRLVLGDVIDPIIELEAETYIMQALEERDSMRRSLSNTDNSTILSHVPAMDKIAHDFSSLSLAEDNVSASQEGVAASTTSSVDAREDAAAPLSRRRVCPPRPSTSSNARQPSPWQAKKRITLEETIFGLTSALSTIYDENSLENKGLEPGDANEQLVGETPANRLSRTVDILFHRNRTETEDLTGATSTNNVTHNRTKTEDSAAANESSNEINSSSTSDASHWRTLKANMIKLTDKTEHTEGIPNSEHGTGMEGGDVEQGAAGVAPLVATAEGDDQQTANECKKKNRPRRQLCYRGIINEELDFVQDFLRPRRTNIYLYSRIIFLYLMIPLLGSAAILFHLVENPHPGQGWSESKHAASWSYWLIFFVRNIITLTFAKCVEVFVIDFLFLHTKATLRLFGPLVTLLVVQSKGWPFLLCMWGILDLAMIAGSDDFSRHWLYWQDAFELFNEENPSGDVTSSELFFRIVLASVSVGAVVSVKRLIVGLNLGRQTFSNYALPLAEVMNKMLLISEVAAVAREIETKSWALEESRELKRRDTNFTIRKGISVDELTGLMASADAEDNREACACGPKSELGAFEMIVDTNEGSLNKSQKKNISKLLGQWEEPLRGGGQVLETIPVSAVLKFRRALHYMDTDFPFSPAFGIADTRETCVASAQDVFLRLLLKTPESDGVVPFETFTTLALQKNGQLDIIKVKDLIRVFRPDRDGSLTLLDFVRSVDAVYKELRLLRASIHNSSKIDKALKNIINSIFYTILTFVILAAFGHNPLEVFVILSGIILAFAFIIGSTSSKYFDGIIFILVQRPYDIGDLINVSNSECESNSSGSQGWIVEDVTLFTTAMVLVASNERATISNGSLASSRIINGARSPKASIYFLLKFGLEVPYEKIEIFRSAVEQYVKARPREWLLLDGFRATRVEADLGFIEYAVWLTHREKWQAIITLMQSKAILQSFCLELQKKMDMRYESPPLPVDLKMVGPAPRLGFTDNTAELSSNAQDAEKVPFRSSYDKMHVHDIDSVSALFEGK